MPRFTKGDLTVETSFPAERVELLAQGFEEHAAKTKEVKEADAEVAKASPSK